MRDEGSEGERVKALCPLLTHLCPECQGVLSINSVLNSLCLWLESLLFSITGLEINPYAAGGKFWQYKMTPKSCKITETLACGYSYESTQQELSYEYQHDRV